MDNMVIAAAVVVVLIVVLVAAYALMSNHTASHASSSSITSTVASKGNTSTISQNVNYATGCTASPGYLCSAANISTYGQITISLTQNTNTTFYNLHAACGVLDLKGQLINASSWYAITNLGTAKPANFTGTTLASGSVENIAGLQCYNEMGMPVSIAAGETYQGTILFEYLNSSAATGGSNPWINATVAAVNLNATG
jgi:hypothetical protein